MIKELQEASESDEKDSFSKDDSFDREESKSPARKIQIKKVRIAFDQEIVESPTRESGTGGLEYRGQSSGGVVSKSVIQAARLPSAKSPVPILTKSITGAISK